MEIIAAREFNSFYILLDCAWLVGFAAILYALKRRTAIVIGLLAGVLYFIVDYGIFYKALGTRVVIGAETFPLLLWLSFSYGFTNFVWIWLLLDRDGHWVEWSLMPITAWLAIGLVSQNFGQGFGIISISRGTGSYHGAMALILLVGYWYLAVRNVRQGDNGKTKVNLLWLLAIGIGVQLSWEGALLIAGIRPPDVVPLIVNSLIETNLGLPLIYLIHSGWHRRRKSLL